MRDSGQDGRAGGRLLKRRKQVKQTTCRVTHHPSLPRTVLVPAHVCTPNPPPPPPSQKSLGPDKWDNWTPNSWLKLTETHVARKSQMAVLCPSSCPLPALRPELALLLRASSYHPPSPQGFSLQGPSECCGGQAPHKAGSPHEALVAQWEGSLAPRAPSVRAAPAV